MLQQLTDPKALIPLFLLTALFLINVKARADFTDPVEVKRLVSEGALLVDVRTKSEYESGHIDGAVNIPVDEVTDRLKDFGNQEKEIVVYCRSGARSERARSILIGEGFKKVYNLGGIGRWPE